MLSEHSIRNSSSENSCKGEGWILKWNFNKQMKCMAFRPFQPEFFWNDKIFVFLKKMMGNYERFSRWRTEDQQILEIILGSMPLIPRRGAIFLRVQRSKGEEILSIANGALYSNLDNKKSCITSEERHWPTFPVFLMWRITLAKWWVSNFEFFRNIPRKVCISSGFSQTSVVNQNICMSSISKLLVDCAWRLLPMQLSSSQGGCKARHTDVLRLSVYNDTFANNRLANIIGVTESFRGNLIPNLPNPRLKTWACHVIVSITCHSLLHSEGQAGLERTSQFVITD